MVEFKELENRFKVVFKGNARLRRAYRSYCNSNKYDLFDCYNSFSDAKRKAFNYCTNQKYFCDGYSGKIVSKNLNIFTYGFLCVSLNICYFCYITPSENIAVPVYLVTDKGESKNA